MNKKFYKGVKKLFNWSKMKNIFKSFENNFNMRPIWPQQLKPFRSESNLKVDGPFDKFLQRDNLDMMTSSFKYVQENDFL